MVLGAYLAFVAALGILDDHVFAGYRLLRSVIDLGERRTGVLRFNMLVLSRFGQVNAFSI